MNTTFTALIVFACLIAAVLIGRTLRGLLPESHLSAESKDAVKLAMGLVATMSALVLGLLVSSAKGSYDTERSEVIQMAAKVAFLNRVLVLTARRPVKPGRGCATPSSKEFGKYGRAKCSGRPMLPMNKQAM